MLMPIADFLLAIGNRQLPFGNPSLLTQTVAQTVGNGIKSGLGLFYRRVRAVAGGLGACQALARKLAELYHRVMTRGLNYVEEGLEKAEEMYVEQAHKRLEKTARKPGYVLVAGNNAPSAT